MLAYFSVSLGSSTAGRVCLIDAPAKHEGSEATDPNVRSGSKAVIAEGSSKKGAGTAPRAFSIIHHGRV